MSRKRRTHSEEFKRQVIAEWESGVSVAELSRRYELSTSLIRKWKEKLRANPKNPFPGQGSRNTDKAKMAEMERMIGRQALEIEFLKNVQRRLREGGR